MQFILFSGPNLQNHIDLLIWSGFKLQTIGNYFGIIMFFQ